MENANHPIDDIFRQRLHDAEVPPPPFVWPAVEQELRKRRHVWVLWLFAFGTVAAAGVWLWQVQNHPKDLLSIVKNERTDDSPARVTETTLHTQTNTIETNSANSAQSASNQAATKLDQKYQEAGTEMPKVQRSKPGTSATTHNNAAEQMTPGQVMDEAVKPASSTETSESASIAENAAGTFLPTQSLAIAEPQAVSSLSKSQTKASPKAFKSNGKRKKAQPKICYDFSRHPNAWLLDVYAGPSLAQRSLTSLPDNQPYLNQRLATEQRNVAMNAGIRASFMFNGNILARTGLHYEQMTEIFEYFDPTTAIYTVTWNPILSKIDTLGVDYGESYLKTYNRYSMLDIPLMVGMEMRKGRSGFSLNAGISANILFKNRGVIIDPNTKLPARFGPEPENPNKIVPVGDLSEDVFRTNLGLSASASIQWYWHLSPTFRLFVEPAYRQILRPVTLSSHPVEQRYSLFELKLGATKIF